MSKVQNRVNPNLVVQVDVRSGRTKGRTKDRGPVLRIHRPKGAVHLNPLLLHINLDEYPVGVANVYSSI